MSLRLVVTGSRGQISRALQELSGPELDVIALSRPEFDLTKPDTIAPALRAANPDAIVNAAAYTAVDKAESEPDAAFAANETGARAVAEAAASLGVPLIQLSTDYVFAGDKPQPYLETDAVGPVGVYGASKLAGERAVLDACADSAVLRTAWVYAPFGNNFVRTMLRLAREREDIAVVADQIGRPTAAADIAAACALIARRLTQDDNAMLRGVFHLAADGEASWADFAEAVFAESARRGGPSARINRITTADFPTAAERPANSRLDGAKLRDAYGLSLPPWRQSLAHCVGRILTETP